MTSRQIKMNSLAARRVLLLGTLPLALAVACSSTTEPQSVVAPATDSTGTSDATPSAPRTLGSQPPLAEVPGSPEFASPRVPGIPSQAQPGVAGAAGVAAPAADRPDRRSGPIQPGITTPNPVPSQPTQPSYSVPANFRAIPNAEPAPAINWQNLHAPIPVTPVTPIAPPPRTLRLGDFTSTVPDEIPDDLLGTVNTNAANLEAAIATGGQSIGLEPGRADKVAAGVVGGAVVGGLAVGIPAAIAGAAVGGAVGAGIGFGVGIAGTPAGAALGAAIAGVPTGGAAAVPGAVAGALAVAGTSTLAGAAIGATVGGAAAGAAGLAVGGVSGGVIGGLIGANV